MPTNHFAVAAVPATGETLGLRTGLVQRYAYCLDVSESASDFVAIDPNTGAICPALIQNGALYGLDNTDTTTAAGPTCLVSNDSKRYKLNSLTTPFSVLSKALTAPPVSPTIGDAYLLYSTPSGAWAGKIGYIAIYTSRGWEFMLPPIGFRILVEDEGAHGVSYFLDPGGSWQAGIGGVTLPAQSIPLSALIWDGRVQNQTTYAPPGSRVTGATPTVPLGGTAANINDNNSATTSITSALGNLTAAAIGSRIIAQLDLGSSQSLIGIEAKGQALSTGTGTAGLYTSPDGVTWTQLGSNLSLTTTPTTFMRTGTVTARYVAIILAQANYSTATAVTADLNAYSSTVTASIGDAYIIGTGGIGIFAGNDAKLAICEIVNMFTIYAVATGRSVYDISLGYDVRWNGGAWNSSIGAVIGFGTPIITDDNSATTFTAGSGAYDFSVSTKPTTSHPNLADTNTISYAAKNSNSWIRLRYECSINSWSTTAQNLGNRVNTDSLGLTIALFIDAQSTALRHRLIGNRVSAGVYTDPVGVQIYEFLFQASDIATHIYKIAFIAAVVDNSTTDNPHYPNIQQRILTVEELRVG